MFIFALSRTGALREFGRTLHCCVLRHMRNKRLLNFPQPKSPLRSISRNKLTETTELNINFPGAISIIICDIDYEIEVFSNLKLSKTFP